MILRTAWRSVWRDKPFFVTATVILALGIGVNLAFITILKTNLSTMPPHVLQPGNLFELSFDQSSLSGSRVRVERTSYPLFEHIREILGESADVACEFRAPVGFGKGVASQEVEATLVSGNYFELLGVKPVMGRPFSEKECVWGTSGDPVAIADHGFWKEAFPDSRADGRVELTIADQPHSLIGVLPEGFRGLSHKPSEIWLPLEPSLGFAYPFASSALEILADADKRLFKILLRPRNGHSPARIQSLLKGALLGSEASLLAGQKVLDVHLEVNRLSQPTRLSETMLVWGSLMALLGLGAACANVAALGLFRNLRRWQATVIQIQLGATRGRIFRQAVAEGLVMSIAATAVALIFFFVIVRTLEKSMGLPQSAISDLFSAWFALVLAATVLAVMCATGMPAGLQSVLVGMAPRFQGQWRPGFLKAGQGRTILVFIQVAVAVCFLAQTALFHTTISNAVSGLGFAPGNLVMLEVPNLRKLGHSEASIGQLFSRFEDRARSLPGVISTATATSGPFRRFQVTSMRGPSRQPLQLGEGIYLSGISPGYISSMGMTLSAGRAFTHRDSSTSEKVAIVNQRLAKQIWGDRNPIGDCLYAFRDPHCRRVVGVLDDHRVETSVFAEPRLQCYLPLSQYQGTGIHRAGDYLLVRVVEGLVAKIIQQLKALPAIPYYVYATEVDAFVEKNLRAMKLGKTVLNWLGLMAVAVAALGIFAQKAFWVQSRKRELGVRMTVGARRSSILRKVLWQGAKPVLFGLAVGLGFSWPASELARTYYFGLGAFNVGLMVMIVLIFLGVGAVACAVPCLRAVNLDPAHTLRTE